jgi:hypothetical protein
VSQSIGRPTSLRLGSFEKHKKLPNLFFVLISINQLNNNQNA